MALDNRHLVDDEAPLSKFETFWAEKGPWVGVAFAFGLMLGLAWIDTYFMLT